MRAVGIVVSSIEPIFGTPLALLYLLRTGTIDDCGVKSKSVFAASIADAYRNWCGDIARRTS